jgi:hypothetical protein
LIWAYYLLLAAPDPTGRVDILRQLPPRRTGFVGRFLQAISRMVAASGN